MKNCKCCTTFLLRQRVIFLTCTVSLLGILKLMNVELIFPRSKSYFVEPHLFFPPNSKNIPPNYPPSGINCTGIFELESSEIEKSLEVRRRHIYDLNDEKVSAMTKNCETYKNLRQYHLKAFTKEEMDFPIAYSMVVHKDAINVERLLHTIYSPYNVYCIHYDLKSPHEFKTAMNNLASCFPNVFIASKLEKVIYAHSSRLQADLNCLSDLLAHPIQWKYVINLCGQDMPLKSNYELVSELKKLDGKNMLESSKPTDFKKQRYTYHHEVIFILSLDYMKMPSKTVTEKSPPPSGIEMYVGSAYFVLSRAFIQYTFESPFVAEFLEWSKDTFSPDEHFWATLVRMPGVPGMAFPVDMLDNCSHDELESLSEDYLSYLRCADPDNPEYFSLRDGREVPISLSTVGYVPLYGGHQAQKVLALFAPEDTLTAVALYLAHQWWTVDDTVRTSKPSRDGLQQVRTLGERVVLYVLNRIIYRKKEMARDEVPFLCHSSSDYAKILWNKGEAIGFYSVKPEGSMCPMYLTQSYTLPVLDTMFVRKRFRGENFALQMLEDYVDSFTEETLGLRYPLSPTMHAACKQYLHKYPGDQELLWEVEGAGHWFQRTLISSILQREAPGLSDAETDREEPISQCTEKSSPEPPADSQPPHTQHLDPELTETGQTEDTEQTQAEAEDEKDIHNDDSIAKSDETPVSTRTRSSQLKRPKIGKKVEDAEPEPEVADSRMESKEQIVENFKELIQQLAEDKDENDMTKLQEEISAKPVQHMLLDSQEVQKALQENADNNEESDLEPVNGDITKDIYEPQLVIAQEISTDALDTESNLEPGDSDKKSLTTLVSVNMDLEKSFEDSFPDQVLNPDELETTTHENVITVVEQTEIQEEEFKERMAEKPNELCVAGANEDLTDNGLPGYTESNSAAECATSDDALTLETASIETTVNVTADSLLRQGPLLVVELQDVAFQQQSDGQRSVSGDQSEGSVETDQSARKSVERGGDSSSEDMETGIPVIERRGGLRRKARAYKGPAKRRAKLSA